MMAGKQRKTPEDFWREYEEQTGERVIARSLGQYVSGWEEFDPLANPIWGLIIATNSGFRFHHFPQASWIDTLFRAASSAEGPKEKTIFIPRERIVSVELRKETKWWKKIFSPAPPRLVIRYQSEAGAERELLLFAEYKNEGIAEAIAG
ncbi:MAG: hypothetical protein LBD18_03010 [Treponema sp.]|jgi:hypothetical protein|nr:hypothetical protein [Treponema sp.]